MKRGHFHHTMLFLLMVSCLQVSSQTKFPYSYSHLSGTYYASVQNNLKKAKPDLSVFPEKSARKKYAELSEDRVSAILNGFSENNFVFQADIVRYLQEITASIQKSNSNLLPETPLVLLDRSDVVNAYALGDNMIVINMGLLLFVESREELALIMAHEMAHNILRHPENSLRETAARLSSEEYRDSLNAVLDSRYERLTRLKKIVVGYSVSRSRHSRYHEASADSLAISLLKNARIGFDAKFFLRLDSVQESTREQLQKPVKHYFEQYKLSFEDSWLKQARGLSSRNYQFRDSSAIDQDSLRTHPDCIVRYEKTKSRTDAQFQFTGIPSHLKEMARKITVWNKIVSLDLTPALYMIFREKENGNSDPWYDFMAGVIFSVLNHADKDLSRFHAVGSRQKEYVATSFFDLQNALTRMNRVVLDRNNQVFQDGVKALRLEHDEKELALALRQLLSEERPDRRKIEQIGKQVFGSGDNPYQELFRSLAKN